MGGLGSGVDANEAYKQVTQKTTFTNILGSSTLADQYLNTTSYLARGHLSPDADFVYVSASYTTYFFINTVPQWQAVNNGNWKSVELAVRSKAGDDKSRFRIITGGFQTLQLNDVNGNLQNIYLQSPNKLAVPKFSWKVAKNMITLEAIAFVTLNNPFVGNISSSDLLCQNICDKYGWINSAWSNPSKGFTYCCDVNELKTVIPTIPDIFYIDVLRGTCIVP